MKIVNKTLLALSITALLTGSAFANPFEPVTPVSGKVAINIGQQSQSIDGGVSVGSWSKSESGVAIGTGSSAIDNHSNIGVSGGNAFITSSAVGSGSHAKDQSSSFGGSSNSDGNSDALGNGSYAKNHSVSVGNFATSSTSSVAVGYNSYAGNGGIAIGARSYSDDGQVSVGSGMVGTKNDTRRIENVSAGKSATDAVNVGQMQTANAKTLQLANQYTNKAVNSLAGSLTDYTDQKVNYLNGEIGNVKDIAEAGTASAMAMSAISIVPNKPISVGFGVAGYGSEGAIALGMKAIQHDSHKIDTVESLSASYDTTHHMGVSAGVTWGF